MIPLLCAVLGSLLLLAVSAVPQSQLSEHVLASAYQFQEEGTSQKLALYPVKLSPSGSQPYTLDNYTDLIMIDVSSNTDTPASTLLNYVSRPAEQRLELMEKKAVGVETHLGTYSRYWMGFRLFTRPLLAVTAYQGIRMFGAAALAILFVLALITTAQRDSLAAAFAMGAACLLVEPYAIVSSLQFSTCFILMLSFVIILNLLRWEPDDRRFFPLFCLFGALTQFFDFYTTPAITLLFPLLLLTGRSKKDGRLRRALLLVFAWFGSYVFMWLVKLAFVTLFTAEDGFAAAKQSFFKRMNLGEFSVNRSEYNPIQSLLAVYQQSTGHFPAFSWPVAGALAAAAALIRKKRTGQFGAIPAYLILSAVPLLWFAVASQPTVIHAWFQYRMVCAVYFAWMLVICEGFGLNAVRCGGGGVVLGKPSANRQEQQI